MSAIKTILFFWALTAFGLLAEYKIIMGTLL